MQIPKDAVLLRIFFGENDRFERQPLYEAIVLKAREMHLAGATVLRGPMGYGHSSRLHTAKILRLSEDLPIIVEIVDSAAKIDEFLPVLDTMMSGGLVTLEKVKVLRYGNNGLSERGQSSAGRRRSRSPEGEIDR
jgi:PII-like signaling protein